MRTIWYISKYAGLPYVRVTSRAFFLVQELNNQGYDAIIFTSDANHQTTPPEFSGKFYLQQVGNVPFVWLKTLKFSNSNSILRILSWLHFEIQILSLDKSKFKKPDTIIVSSLSLLTILSGIYFKWRYKTKLIVEIRDIWPLSLIDEGNYSSKNPAVIFLSWIEKLGYRSADAIIGTMPNLGAHVKSILGQHKGEVFCIPQGYDKAAEAHFKSLDPEFVKTYISNEKFIVCYAGTLGRTNNLDQMIDAARILVQEIKIHFLIVGDGDDKKRLVKITEHLPNVTIAPPISNTQVHELLSKYADIVFLAVSKSKIWEYGQSLNKLVDYMRSGKPVVAAFGGYQSMINEANCGSFVEPGSPHLLAKEIQYYAKMPVASRIEIGKRGAEWIEQNRGFDKLGKELADIIEKIS